MNWPIQDVFKGEEVFLIGGGPSLKTFDFDLLKGRNTIGCNSAWRKGAEICERLIFCDIAFWESEGEQVLREYEGEIFAQCPAFIPSKHPRMLNLPRVPKGIHRDKIGFNTNTGFAAINLACIMGAGTIYLLGYDMRLGEEGGRKVNNYHDYSTFPPNPAVYTKFIAAATDVKNGLEKNFPEVKVINLNPDSALEIFPKQTLESVFEPVPEFLEE